MRCMAGSSLLHCEFIPRQIDDNRINLYTTMNRHAVFRLHCVFVLGIYYSNLLGTSFDIHEMIARPLSAFPLITSFLSEPQLSSPHVVTAVADVTL